MSLTKPCKFCDQAGHYPYQCRYNPRRKKYIRRLGKVGATWSVIRHKWFLENPADYYTCYLCGKSLLPAETTLDHVIPRSHAPHLRYKMDNIKPCCYQCNAEKGSKH